MVTALRRQVDASGMNWQIARTDDPRGLSQRRSFGRVAAKKKKPRGSLYTQYLKTKLTAYIRPSWANDNAPSVETITWSRTRMSSSPSALVIPLCDAFIRRTGFCCP